MSSVKRQPSEGAGRGGGDDAARAKARRTAWLLGGLALAFYFGYMVLMFLRGPGGA